MLDCHAIAHLARLPTAVLFCCSIEYNMSYVYHSMSTYFNRDNVALPGLAAYFRAQSDEERGHAQLLMDFQVNMFSSPSTLVTRIKPPLYNRTFSQSAAFALLR